MFDIGIMEIFMETAAEAFKSSFFTKSLLFIPAINKKVARR